MLDVVEDHFEVLVDLLNQVVNVNVVRSFHHRIWHTC